MAPEMSVRKVSTTSGGCQEPKQAGRTNIAGLWSWSALTDQHGKAIVKSNGQDPVFISPFLGYLDCTQYIRSTA